MNLVGRGHRAAGRVDFEDDGLHIFRVLNAIETAVDAAGGGFVDLADERDHRDLFLCVAVLNGGGDDPVGRVGPERRREDASHEQPVQRAIIGSSSSDRSRKNTVAPEPAPGAGGGPAAA